MSDDINIEVPDDAPDWAKNLRKQYDAIKTDNVRLLKENGEYAKATRTTSVAELLKAKNVNPKVAALVPKDVEPTAAGIDAWLTEFGDVFGVTAEEPDDAGADPDDVAAFALAQQAGHAGNSAPQSGTASTVKRWEEAAGTATSLDDLIAQMNGTARR